MPSRGSYFNFNFIYTTNRIVKIPNKCLYFTHKLIILFIIFYIGVYGLWIRGGYQESSPIESVAVTKVKGVVSTVSLPPSAWEPGINPLLYKRVWDAPDLVLHQGGDGGSFTILTNILITPNQTRTNCPDSPLYPQNQCSSDKDCLPLKDKVLPIGNGPITGRCVGGGNMKTCEVSAWCPVELNRGPLRNRAALLQGTKEFTFLLKNSIEFPSFGASYKRRNIVEGLDPGYLQNCVYDGKRDPGCPTFRIGDVVTGAGFRWEDVAPVGGIFALKVQWYCSFDFGATIQHCRPKYSFARLDNPSASVAPGFNFGSVIIHEEDRRTLVRNVGIKIVIQVEGEGRRLDVTKLLLALGAGMGLFAIASSICDFLLKVFVQLRGKVGWKWLQCYTEDIKYDLSHMKCGGGKEEASPQQCFNKKTDQELEEIKTLQ